MKKDQEKDQSGQVDPFEIEKAKSHIVVEIIEYIHNSVVIKTILKRSTGNISIMSFDRGEGLSEKTSPFDTFAQLIDGKVELIIDGKTHFMKTGEGIILPAHRPHSIKPNGQFKIILTVIKSGYE